MSVVWTDYSFVGLREEIEERRRRMVEAQDKSAAKHDEVRMIHPHTNTGNGDGN